MKLTLTVKFQPESEEERLYQFASGYEYLRGHIEQQIENGVFGPKEKVESRWLLDTRLPQTTVESSEPSTVQTS